jgi:hypothetical protein
LNSKYSIKSTHSSTADFVSTKSKMPAPFYTLSPDEKSKAVKRLCKEVALMLTAAGGGTVIGGWLAWWTIRTQAVLLAQLIGVPVGIATVVAVMVLNSMS